MFVMPSHQALKDDALLAESYYDSVHSRLLLETPATKANIERFIKKYMPNLNVAEPTKVHIASTWLPLWTPKVQQTIKAAGGSPDIFGYPDMDALQKAFDNAHTSKTDIKKAYKHAKGMPIIYETDEYIVYQPQTWDASRKFFGVRRVSLLDSTEKSGSHWCTASSHPDHFEQYVKDNKDRLLYFIRKSDDTLSAIRSKHLRQPEAAYHKWRADALPIILRTVEQFKTAARGTVENQRAWMDLFTQIYDIEPYGIIEEYKTQMNDSFDSLYQMYMNLGESNFKLMYEDPPRAVQRYIKFIALVVFGLNI